MISTSVMYMESLCVNLSYSLKSDCDLIAALVERGFDVNKEHLVSYIIDCSTEQQVNNIITDAVQKGFEDDYASYSEKTKFGPQA